jgi:hypothetical protein
MIQRYDIVFIFSTKLDTSMHIIAVFISGKSVIL